MTARTQDALAPLTQPDRAANSGRSAAVWIALVALCVLAAVEFGWRTLDRALTDSGDFTGPYISARAWLMGKDPFDYRANRQLMLEVSGKRHTTRPSYPPSALPLLAPFAAMPWTIARGTWLVTNLLSYAMAMGAVISWSGLARMPRRRLIAIAVMLGWAPVHTAVGLGQPSVVASSLVVLSLWQMHRSRHLTAGVFGGLATALKPQIGLVVIIYLLATRRWKTGFAASTVLAALMLFGHGRMWWDGIESKQGWLHHVHAVQPLLASNSGHSPRARQGERPIQEPREPQNKRLGPSLRGRLDLHTVLCFVIRQKLSDDVSMALVLLPGLWWLAMVWRARRPEDEMLAVGPLLILSLLAVYHRTYDAVWLIIPLTWAIARLGRMNSLAPALTVGALAVFLVPGYTLLKLLMLGGHIPTTVSHAWWWQGVVLPHATWALCIAAAGQLTLMHSYTAGLETRDT